MPEWCMDQILQDYLQFVRELERLSGSQKKWFNVHSSSTSTMVDVGEDAIMNCYLNPEISAEDMEIRWIKDNDGSTIYKYRKGVEELEGVNSAFHGRTELIRDGIKKGNISLKILNIQPSDNGLYTCYFQSTFMFDKARIEILPRSIGTNLFFSIEPQELNLKVTCSSSGWYPQPDGQWFSDDKKNMTEYSKFIDKADDGLYSINISTIFTKEYKNKYCIIKNSYLEHQRGAAIYLAELKREIVKKGFEQAKQHVVDVSLDPETAHPELKVSDDLKCLSRGTERQNVSDHEKRFDTRLYVLGNEGLSKEHNYWMVNVQGLKHWTIGVASENIPRKGKLNLSPEEGFWVIELNKETYTVYEDRPKDINISEPCHIGVYVQLKKEKIVFYDADKGHIIHSFHRKGQSPIQLYPFFSIWDIHENIHNFFVLVEFLISLVYL
ncbi:butyrophilin subfamily 2 member A2-like, partial [Bufo bufo]|uniref:butyrophilin subfamily 2 member A2-like n=1 Tax=Bufo bufo TaxID=8384 RepID=UPI001ABE89B2